MQTHKTFDWGRGATDLVHRFYWNNILAAEIVLICCTYWTPEHWALCISHINFYASSKHKTLLRSRDSFIFLRPFFDVEFMFLQRKWDCLKLHLFFRIFVFFCRNVYVIFLKNTKVSKYLNSVWTLPGPFSRSQLKIRFHC